VRAINSLTEDYVVLGCNTVQSGRNFYQCFGETCFLHRNVEVLFVTEGHVRLECDAVHFHIYEKVRVTYHEEVMIMLTTERPSDVGFINSLVTLLTRGLRF
jgi:hypothetical protein